MRYMLVEGRKIMKELDELREKKTENSPFFT